MFIYFLINRLPPISTRPDALLPYTSLFRSLGLGQSPLQLASTTSVRDILTTLGRMAPPALLVIDSIQTMHSDLIEGAPGTVSQVRAPAQELIRFAKERGTALALVVHVTQDGRIAAPCVLAHMVDTGLQIARAS